VKYMECGRSAANCIHSAYRNTAAVDLHQPATTHAQWQRGNKNTTSTIDCALAGFVMGAALDS